MPTQCPCGAAIPISDINVGQGVALCRVCGKLSRLADLAGVDDADLPRRSATDQAEERKALLLAQGDPPRGCAIHDYGDRVVLRASARSLAGAVGLLFFTVFWNGIVSVFVALAAAGLWANIIGPPPSWFPAPNMNGGPMSLGMTLFLCVFLLPFLFVGAMMAACTMVAIAGKVEVRLRGPDGIVFTGVGPIGWKRRFDADHVAAVHLTDADIEENGKKKRAIAIDVAPDHGGKTIKFASLLPDQRRLWLGGVLKTMLLPLPRR